MSPSLVAVSDRLWELEPASGSVMAKAILSSPVAKPRQPPLLLGLGPELGDDGGADGRRHHDDQQRAAGGGQLLLHDGQLGDPTAAPAVLLGHVDARGSRPRPPRPTARRCARRRGPCPRSTRGRIWRRCELTASRSICCSSDSDEVHGAGYSGRSAGPGWRVVGARRQLGRARPGCRPARLRRYSPRPLAWGSGRVDEATPSPSSPTTTKLSAHRFGNAKRRTSRSSASGSRGRNASTVRSASSQAQAASRPGPEADVGVAALVARAGPDDGAEGEPPGRARRRAGGRTASAAATVASVPARVTRPVAARWAVWGTSTRRPSAWTTSRDDQVGGDQRRPVHAVDGGAAGGRGQVEPGVAGQGQLGGGVGEPPAHPSGSASFTVTRSWAVASTLTGRRLCRSGSGGRRSRRSRRPPPRAASSDRRVRSAFSSMSSPVRTKVIELRQPPEQVDADLDSSGAGRPRAPEIRTRSGPTCSTAMVSNRATTSVLGYSGRRSRRGAGR